MKEKFVGIGLLGLASLGGSTACTEDRIEGTVLEIREEAAGSYKTTAIRQLPDCPKPDQPAYLGDTAECAIATFELELQVFDAPDRILRLKEPDGVISEWYVWPRVTKKAEIGKPISFNAHHGSLTDNNNEETVISKVKIGQ